MTTTVESTRNPNWIPIKPGDGAIRGGDRYRIERPGGSAYEFDAPYDWEQKDFIPDANYFIWPRPTPKPWKAIPEGLDDAAVMTISVDDQVPVVGTYYRSGANIYGIDPEGDTFAVCDVSRITSAVPMVVVPDETLDELRAAWQRWDDSEIVVSDFVVGDLIIAAGALLDAIDGADQ